MIKSYSHQRFSVWAGLLVAVAMVANVASGAVEWNDDFEGYPLGSLGSSTNEWAFTGTGDAAAAVTNGALTYSGTAPADGTQALYVPQDTVATASTNDAGGTNVWVDMYIQPNLYDGVAPNRAVPATGSAIFMFASNGVLVVHEGATPTNWVQKTTDIGGAAVSAITGTKMVRVTAYLNYGSDSYALFMDDQLIDESIAFRTSIDDFDSVEIDSDAYVDNVWVSSTQYPDGAGTASDIPLTGDADNDGLPDAYELYHFGAALAHLPGTDTDGDGRSDAGEYQDGTDPNDANSVSWVIPYFEKFAAGANGQALDTTFNAFTELAGTATITDTHLTAMSDERGIALSAGGLSVVVSNAAGTNVFCQVYVKPVACPEIPAGVVTDQAAAICVVSNVLYVYNDTNWEATTISGAQLTNGTWIGLAAHLVYNGVNGQGTWDLYYTADDVFVSQMTKVNAAPYLFNDGYVGDGIFSELVITNESSVTTHVDAVAVSLSYSPTHTDYTNLVIFERVAGDNTVAARPPYNYANPKISDGGGLTALGDDLSIGLFPGDSVLVSNQFEYVLQNSGVFNREVGASDPTIKTTTGLVIKRKPGSDTLAFYPYSNVVNWSSTEIAVSTTDPAKGRTDLVVPSTYPGGCIDINDKNSLGFDGTANDSDELLFFNPNTRRTKKFHYSTASSSWLWRGQLITFQVCPGDAFMYYNRTASSVTWTLTN
ncbi:MAG: hypothetical protein HQ523_15805 [Lentisphaerae bacterium]|nr:hypothetical protein [Lentisphaerota bacterium]